MVIRAKKSLGQNFLRSPAILRKIADAGAVGPDDTVLEIGPGEGTLTAELLSRHAHVVAIEKDDRLVPILTERFASAIDAKKLSLIHGDALTVDLDMLPFDGQPYKVVANIPYYITRAIIRRLLESARQPTTIVLLVQKEVADRIVAREGHESILSISVKAYGVPRYIATVPRGAFSPVPRVDSAIIAIDRITKDNFRTVPEDVFFSLLKKGFSSKRKLLTNNLPLSKETGVALLGSLGIPENIRAEELSLEQWRSLAEKVVAESDRN